MTVIIPIIPKVPVRLPGRKRTSWRDLTSHLNRKRILFLCQELDTEISSNLISAMLYLSMQDYTQDLYLFINSPGGEIINGMAIHNIMRFIPSHINTICLGIAASMACYVLVGGESKKRAALPHARIMIHQPACNFVFPGKDNEDKAGPVYSELEGIISIRETITRVYSERTGKPFWMISQDLERDFYMSAMEAKDYGIVDRIVDRIKEKS
uniref:ATP-dependent Clp protease proteolytic subunit n=1 Tax=Rhipsalis baccifera TaxID=722799 RepID=A0A7L8ZQW7_9CARY|nr:clp protease proteolytic subunit [Rhipsalis baccifera]QOI72662.1 clp protease proteolytic subunit [Rhipsalis baccifera]